MKRAVAAVAVVVAGLALVPASPSVAQVAPLRAHALLDDADAIELANKLAEATEDQGVCYGWSVTINDEDRGFAFDQGSSLGPERRPDDPACTPSVVFVADLLYTSELSEAADSASIRVDSTLPGLSLSGDDFRDFGVTGAALLGDNDDVALVNAVAALPLLVAEAGLAPAVQPEQTTGTIPAADRPTGGGGSDRLRTYGSLYFLAITIILGGVGWLATAWYLGNSTRSSTGDAPWTS